MLLFDDFKAIKYEEENLILITYKGMLRYIYYPKYRCWKKHKCSYDYIKDKGWISLDLEVKTKNYPDINSEELIEATNGKFPRKETDILRLCIPESLSINDYMEILKEDYPEYMLDEILDSCDNSLSEQLERYENTKYTSIKNGVYQFMSKAPRLDKAYISINELLKEALSNNYDNVKTINEIRELSFSIIGRDIYNEVSINDGYTPEANFYIMPARVVYKDNTENIEYIINIEDNCISIDQDNSIYYCGVDYIMPFLINHYDPNLDANIWWDNGMVEYIDGSKLAFKYNDYNYYSIDDIENILKEIKETIIAIENDKETQYTKTLKPITLDIDKSLLIDFYEKFIYRMEYMLKVSIEMGYNLILWNKF